jgi:transcriptional regulator with XRE-family HTH domain
MILDYQLIGKRIKEIRLENDLTQAELAEKSNLAVSYISRIESGKKNASLKSLVKLGNSLGVTVDTFLLGNQKNDLKKYLSDLIQIFEDFNNNQNQMISEIVMLREKFL